MFFKLTKSTIFIRKLLFQAPIFAPQTISFPAYADFASFVTRTTHKLVDDPDGIVS